MGTGVGLGVGTLGALAVGWLIGGLVGQRQKLKNDVPAWVLVVLD